MIGPCAVKNAVGGAPWGAILFVSILELVEVYMGRFLPPVSLSCMPVFPPPFVPKNHAA